MLIWGTGWGRKGLVSLQDTDTKRDQEWDRVGRSEQNIQVLKVMIEQGRSSMEWQSCAWNKTIQDKSRQSRMFTTENSELHTKNCGR